jgi:hypothetical protein
MGERFMNADPGTNHRGNPMLLTVEELKKLVAGDTVAIRGVATLEPAGGPGDKIFPPTHAVDDKNKKPGAKYAFETRRIDGHDVRAHRLRAEPGESDGRGASGAVVRQAHCSPRRER